MSDTKELETQALSIPAQARAIKIVDAGTYQQAGGILVAIKGLRKQINASYDPIILAAHMAHKTAVAEKKRVENPLVEAEGVIKPGLAAYDSEQEKKRIAEEQRLQAIARKAEEDRKLAEAVALDGAGEKKAADAVMAEPVYTPPVIVAKTTPKVNGVSFTERWIFRIVNPLLIPRDYLMPDTVKIGQYARAMKLAGRIPGVEIYSEKSVSGRG